MAEIIVIDENLDEEREIISRLKTAIRARRATGEKLTEETRKEITRTVLREYRDSQDKAVSSSS